MALFYPPSFQGNLKKKQYFEGWYCKHVSPEPIPTTLAVIPGISLGQDSHSFIQVNISRGPQIAESRYIRFPLTAAALDTKTFRVSIGNNHFSLGGMELNISEPDFELSGTIEYHNPREYPVSLGRPGIMGPYRYVPAMECYHGLVSAHHELGGTMSMTTPLIQEPVHFTGGQGYIEKDWGKSFPSSWIWMQANSFTSSENQEHQQGPVSFMLSVARIPWIGKTFTGFLGYLYINETYYPFATYTGAVFHNLAVFPDRVTGRIMGKGFDLEFTALRDDGAELTAPERGNMTRTIKESVAASIELGVKLTGQGDNYRGISRAAGLEVSGDIALDS